MTTVRSDTLPFVLEAARIGTWDWNLRTGEVAWSENLEAIHGFPTGSFGNSFESLLAFIHPQDQERVDSAVSQALAERASYELEFRICPPEGGIRWMLSQGTVFCDAAGRTTRMAGIAMDVTGRKTNEERLRRSEAQLAEAQRLARMGSWEWDLTSNTMSWSEELCWVFRARRSEFAPTYEGFLDRVHPDDQETVQQVIDAARRDKQPFEFDHRIVFTRGEVRIIHVRGRVIADQQGNPTCMLGTCQDVTAQREADARARELEREQIARMEAQATHARIASILDGITHGFFALDRDWRFIFVNPAAARDLGATAEQLVGRDIWELFPQAVGSPFHQAYQRSMQEQIPVQFTAQSTLRLGVWLEVVTHPYPEGISVYCQDVTERRQAEEELIRSNAELKSFAYVASHDLQEPLRKIQTFSDRLTAQYADTLGERGQDYLERMQSAAARMQSLINELLALSRVRTRSQTFALVDLARTAHEVATDLEAQVMETGAQIEIGELPVLAADALQMRQLFQNLIGNALKFRRRDVAPVIRVHSEPVEADGSSHGTPAEWGACRITIEDNGIGFEEQYAERIFVPFQRLHGRTEYQGMGMGLAICKKIVDRHRGSITVRSVPGSGSTFTIVLPSLPAAATGSTIRSGSRARRERLPG